MPVRPEEIIDQLPDLRRYAFAVVGDRRRADALVEACLEQLLADQTRVEQLRLALYTMFDRLHDGDRAAPNPGPRHGTDAAESRGGRLEAALARLPIDERKALLLTGMVRLAETDTAAVLGVSVPMVIARVRAARERLRRELSCRVLVIQREPLVALSIAHVVRDLGHQLCGIALTQYQALARANGRQPDLILADSRLSDGGDGVAAVRAIRRGRPVPAILIADQSDAAACAALSQSLVIVKPFAPSTLKAAMRRALAGDIS